MRRALVVLILLGLALAGCGGSTADVAVPDPPKATALEKGDNQKINQIIEGWQAQVPGVLEQYQIKKDTIQEKVYQSSASLQEVVDFYKQQITSANGWVEARGMPGQQGGIFLNAYDHGTISLVIGAFDATQVGGTGTVIYTAKGTK